MALGRLITLDALGTLVELEPPAPLLVAELRSRGVAVDEAAAARAIGAEIAYYREHHDEAGDAPALAELRDRCTEVLRGALPSSARGLAHGELRGALLAALRFRPYPEVPGALAALRAGGHALVVVSNWDVSLHETLARTGLRPLVDGAISSAEAGAAKPERAIFARALAVAGAAAGEATHVGDSPEQDVRGALDAGLGAVLVRRSASAPPAPAGVRTIASLAELAHGDP